MRTCHPLAAPLIALLLAPVASADTEELTAPQKANIEKQTCQAWHSRRVAEMRARVDRRLGVWRVTFACESHDVVRGHALRATGECTGIDPLWKCEDFAPQLDLAPGNWAHPLSFSEMAPERALDIYGFLEERARRDKELGPDELQGDPHIFWNDVAKHYNVTFSFRDWTYSYTVTENCSQRGCRRKLKFSGFYGNHDYGD